MKDVSKSVRSKKRCIIELFIMSVIALTFVFPTIAASAFTQSVELGVDCVRAITDNQYSEGTKQWVISDTSVVEAVTGDGTSTPVIKGVAEGSTTVICKTYYTTWTTKYDPVTGTYVPTTTQGMVYSTFNITVTADTAGDSLITLLENDKQKEIEFDENNTASVLSGAKRIVLTNRENESLKWESSDTSIVDVDGLGCIVAIKPGTAVISASHSDYGTLTCIINVEDITKDSRYTPISTAEELLAISGGAQYSRYYLTNDIDLAVQDRR